MHNNQNNLVDQREQTFNQGHCGKVEMISTAIDNVGQINAIMFDIDLKLFNPNGVFSSAGMSATDFYERHVAFWLDNHPLLRKAEVRFTGNGFHVLLKLDKPIVLNTPNLQKRWRGFVQAVQMILPTDPQQPGINALTRPVGSVNSKNNEIVTCLRPGELVSEQEILALYNEMRHDPLPTLLKVWFGSEKVTPCPICQGENSYLEAASPKKGRCYGNCYKAPTIQSLFCAVMQDSTTNTKGDRR